MRVPRERERDAGRHAREDVGLVRQQDHGGVVRDLGQRAVEIVHALERAPGALAPTVEEGHLVAEAREPERAAVVGQTHDVVLVDRHALALQHAPAEHGALARALGGEVVPPVVVAEDGVHAERRFELAQRLGPYLRRDGAGLELVAGGEVAQQDDDVGFQRIGVGDDAADALGGHGRAAGVHVGDDADAEIEVARPVGRGDAVARHLQPPVRLDGEAVAGQPHHAGAGEAERLQEPAPRDAFHVCFALYGAEVRTSRSPSPLGERT